MVRVQPGSLIFRDVIVQLDLVNSLRSCLENVETFRISSETHDGARSYPTSGGVGVHVIDELLLVHHVHLQHELLFDDLGHRCGILPIPPDLCQTYRRPPTESEEETFLESVADVLGNVVVPGTDDDSLAAAVTSPPVCWSHCCLMEFLRLISRPERMSVYSVYICILITSTTAHCDTE